MKFLKPIVSEVPQGTAPLQVESTTVVANLNADLLDGQEGSYYAPETRTTIGTLVNSADGKTTPVDGDMLAIVDSEATNIIEKVTWANHKATLKIYFDNIYNNYAHPTGDGNLHVPANSTTNDGNVLTATQTAGTYAWETPVSAQIIRW